MTQPKRILLCNDDGFDAPGICALEKALTALGEVWKIAPDQQRSGCSHALNFHSEVYLERVTAHTYRIQNGYPADCANVGFHAPGFPPFDIVVSGINHGPNLGDDVHYSGTVAAARQGAIHHIRAVAVSAVDVDAMPQTMQRIADWLVHWLRENYATLSTRITYNINYPLEDSDQNTPYPRVCFSYQGQRNYKDEYIELAKNGHPPNLRVLRLIAKELGHLDEDNSDFEAVLNGCISITPLSTYTTHIQELHKWMTQSTTKNTPQPSKRR